MDIKRAKELTHQLANLIDQIDKQEISKFNRMTEAHKNEIRIKFMAILNELNIRSGEIIDLETESD
jgi:hypothetical protein